MTSTTIESVKTSGPKITAALAIPCFVALGLTACSDASEGSTSQPAPAPPKLEAMKSFDCLPGAISAPTPIADVSGEPGAEVVILPTPQACQFELGYRDSGGTVTPLSRAAGGYLLAPAGRTPAGDVVVCASNLVRRADSGSTGKHVIERVTLMMSHATHAARSPSCSRTSALL